MKNSERITNTVREAVKPRTGLESLFKNWADEVPTYYLWDMYEKEEDILKTNLEWCWITRDSEGIPIRSMVTRHLLHSISHIRRNCRDYLNTIIDTYRLSDVNPPPYLFDEDYLDQMTSSVDMYIRCVIEAKHRGLIKIVYKYT